MSIEHTTFTQQSAHKSQRRVPLSASYDLLFLVLLALALPLLQVTPWPILRIAVGLPAVLFAPGYTLTAAAFPRRADMGGVARAALSFGLSVAVIPILALLLDRLPWGLRPLPIVLAMASFILVASCVALVRRMALPADVVAVPPAIEPLSWSSVISRRVLTQYLLGGLVLAIVLGTAAYSLARPDPSSRLTEFYALGAGGLAESYPREIAPGQSIQVELGIVNREGAPGRYRVEARSAGQLLAQAGPIDLIDGASWRAPLSYALPQPGLDQQVDILLYRDDAPQPYRQLRLYVNVLESNP